MPLPKISILEMGRFPFVTIADRRRIVSRYLPKSAGNSQGPPYYGRARGIINAYHTLKRDKKWLIKQANILLAESSKESGMLKRKLQNNSDSILKFHKSEFSDRHYDTRIGPSLPFEEFGVRFVGIFDLTIKEENGLSFVAIDYIKHPPLKEGIEIIKKLLWLSMDYSLAISDRCLPSIKDHFASLHISSQYWNLASGKRELIEYSLPASLDGIEFICHDYSTLWVNQFNKAKTTTNRKQRVKKTINKGPGNLSLLGNIATS